MIDELLDERTADAIVGGNADPDALAPPLQNIALLCEVARSPAVPEELENETVVAAAFAEIARAQATMDLEPLRHRRRKRRAAKAVAALALVAFTGTAAAATNQLPDAVQTVVSDAGSHVGVHLPKPKHASKSEAPSAGTDTNPSQGQGPDATGPAKGGLCTAHFARGTSPSDHAGGLAEQNLQAAAAAAGQSVDEFCADVVHQPSSSPQADAPADSPGSDSGGENSQKPAQPGKPAATPSASAHPNNGKPPDTTPAGGARRAP
jgi:hypothetical protein